MRLLILFFISFSLSVVSFASMAYSVSNHYLITNSAVDFLKNCHEKGKGSNTEKVYSNKKYILKRVYVKYNAKQDNLIKKSVLWHFHHTESAVELAADVHPLFKLTVTDTTFNNWFEYLVKEASYESNVYQRATAVGGLLHYVQDMAVPAHVAPIFHPSRLANRDKFDEWSRFDAAVDDEDNDGYVYSVNSKGKIKDKDKDKDKDKIYSGLSKMDCSKLKDVVSPMNLLIDLKTSTLKSINEGRVSESCKYLAWFPIGCERQTNQLKWSSFWGTEIDDKGFSHYGCNKKDVFGESYFSCDGVYANHIKDEVYIEFAKSRLEDAIVSSARLIKYFQDLPPESGSASQCERGHRVASKGILKCLTWEGAKE